MGGIVIRLLFPGIIAAAILFPAYVIMRYCAIVRVGDGDVVVSLRRRFIRMGIALSVAVAVVLFIGIFYQSVSRSLSRFVEAGGLAAVVPLIFVDVVLGAVFSRERALRRRAESRRST